MMIDSMPDGTNFGGSAPVEPMQGADLVHGVAPFAGLRNDPSWANHRMPAGFSFDPTTGYLTEVKSGAIASAYAGSTKSGSMAVVFWSVANLATYPTYKPIIFARSASGGLTCAFTNTGGLVMSNMVGFFRGIESPIYLSDVDALTSNRKYCGDNQDCWFYTDAYLSLK
jgi:hypothetical protein